MINPSAVASVRERIEKACARSGRDRDPPVEIVAVTKGFPSSIVIAAYEIGLRTIGENRVQEAMQKFAQLPELHDLRRRLIGHLQTNKVRKAVETFDAIDSIDSLKLAKRVSQIALAANRCMPVLLQVNTARDPLKFGFSPEQVDELYEIVELPGIRVDGLMTIGALTEETSSIRETFQRLRRIREDMNRYLPKERRLVELSMGMTGDFEIAVEEGATMVRIGTALFGERPQ